MNKMDSCKKMINKFYYKKKLNKIKILIIKLKVQIKESKMKLLNK